jgi:hypothetical protein
MARLTAEGLTRHESVHAIASVVAEHVYDLSSGKADASDSQAIYNATVERLTAKELAWLSVPPNFTFEGSFVRLDHGGPPTRMRSRRRTD